MELEKRFKIAEKAVYRRVQKRDEAADFFLARSDVAWTELFPKKMTLAELQAYIVLRGSRLSGDDKKRVLVQSRRLRSSGNDQSCSCRENARIIIFSITCLRKERKPLKTYNQPAFVAEEWDETHDDGYKGSDEWHDDDFEYLAHEDDDAALVVQFDRRFNSR